MGTQLQYYITKFVLDNISQITKTDNFLSGTLGKFYIQLTKNSLGNFRISYCEKLVGEKYKICENWYFELNELRVKNLINQNK